MSTFNSQPVTRPLPLPPSSNRLREDVLARLHWSILGSVEDITIEDGFNEDRTAQLLPFLSHTLATENATVLRKRR